MVRGICSASVSDFGNKLSLVGNRAHSDLSPLANGGARWSFPATARNRPVCAALQHDLLERARMAAWDVPVSRHLIDSPALSLPALPDRAPQAGPQPI